jgi:hypothetical protein
MNQISRKPAGKTAIDHEREEYRARARAAKEAYEKIRAVDWNLVAKLIRILSSPNESEVASAARALGRLDLHTIAAQLEEMRPIGGMYERGHEAGFEAGRLRESIEHQARWWRESGRWGRPCKNCGRKFTGRSDALTCSTNCRVALHRRRHRKRR